MPAWWNHAWVHDRLMHEQQSLNPGWRDPAAWLHGLKDFPVELDFSRHPAWPTILYVPEQRVIQEFLAEKARLSSG